jgi:two-component system alkaline phosphatase synthesis response regulator PhoP
LFINKKTDDIKINLDLSLILLSGFNFFMETKEYKILIVDDEDDILEFVSYNLRKEGYQVMTTNNGKDAVKIAREKLPHLVILDVMMPEMDGIETCRELRNLKALDNSIITFFTARNEDYSQIAGFEAGADDYITKPIKPRLLTSKVNALLRRHVESTKNISAYSLGALTIDPQKYVVYYNGKEYSLPRKEFELLSLLTSKPNNVFTRDQIFSRIWSNEVIVGDRTIDVHIRKLREKLGIDNIKTIKGVGYKYEFKE